MKKLKLYKEILEAEIFEEQSLEKYYDETPEKIAFNSESLFTKKFVKDLDFILNHNENSGQNFRKLPKAKQRKKLAELDNLLQTETMWKDLIKSSKFKSHRIREIFPKESKQFIRFF